MASTGAEVWVTRTEPGASATARRLAEAGLRPLLAPLLEVRPLPPPPDMPAGVTTLAFTSANGVRAFTGWSHERALAVFAVGAGTAAAARAAGFATVGSAQGEVQALAAALAEARPSGKVLHPCGRERAGDLAGLLAPLGVEVETLPLYETLAVGGWPPAAAAALRQTRLSTILLHSPKAARALGRLLEGGERFDLSAVEALGLSQACVAPLAHAGFRRCAAAARPDEAALLELLA